MPVAEKPALLLLGGMMCDRRLWDHQLEALAACFDPIEVADITRSSSIRAIADDVLRQAPPRFVLAGLSMGGIVAFELWRRAPQRITHLALFDTNAAAEQPERRSLRAFEIERAHNGELAEIMVREFKPRYLAESSRQDQGLLDSILEMALRLGPEVFERQSLALRDRPDSIATLATISCPTVVACGSEDRLCPVSFHRDMARRIPGASLRVIEGCGHLPPVERPEEVSDILRGLVGHTERDLGISNEA